VVEYIPQGAGGDRRRIGSPGAMLDDAVVRRELFHLAAAFLADRSANAEPDRFEGLSMLWNEHVHDEIILRLNSTASILRARDDELTTRLDTLNPLRKTLVVMSTSNCGTLQEDMSVETVKALTLREACNDYSRHDVPFRCRRPWRVDFARQPDPIPLRHPSRKAMTRRSRRPAVHRSRMRSCLLGHRSAQLVSDDPLPFPAVTVKTGYDLRRSAAPNRVTSSHDTYHGVIWPRGDYPARRSRLRRPNPDTSGGRIGQERGRPCAEGGGSRGSSSTHSASVRSLA
jgi:hypothetical protein